jgi:uncharacterized damage-inducible protein DinB
MYTALRIAALATLCVTTATAAQSGGTPAAAPAPVADAFREMTGRMARILVAAAEEMPADKYGFKPTPPQMSFGDVIGHLAEGNDYFCSKIGDTEAPKRTELAKDAGKDQLVARLKETFQFCDAALAKADDSKLSGKVPFFGNREISRAAAILAAAEDWGDHYSQLAIYLRLNGHLPPTAKKKQA